MRAELLKYVRCPKCASNLNIEVNCSDDTEITRGCLKCETCSSTYKIEQGMPFLYMDNNNWIQKAKEADGWVDLHKSKGIYDQAGVHIDFILPYFKEEPWIKVSEMFDICLDILKLSGSEKILDLGAGRGWAAKHFALKGCESFAMDIVADDQIGLGRSKEILKNANIYYERLIGDSENIPFKSEMFDVIFCAASVHHTSDIGILLSNVYRTLKYGGTFIAINEPCISMFENESNVLMDSEELKYNINEKRPNLLEYHSTLSKIGFVDISIFPYQVYKMGPQAINDWHNHYKIDEHVESILKMNSHMNTTSPSEFLVNSVLLQYGGEVIITARKPKRLKIAFVVQRYGLEVNGGSESHCRQVAEHLSKYHDVEIITTCAIDYMTWENEYPSGKDTLNGVTIWRFPVDHPRDVEAFNKLSEILFYNYNGKDKEIEWMKLQGPYSTALLDFIRGNGNKYDNFIFFTYLYCTTFFGLPLVKEKAILVPTAHDEPPIYLDIFRDVFASPNAIMYNTEEEKNFIENKFNNSNVLNDLVGVGIEVPEKRVTINFRDKYNIRGDFITFIGRIDESKGCNELFGYFLRYKKEVKSNLKLILIGKVLMKIPAHESIITLGFVSEEDKFAEIEASKLVIMPSKYESFSMVVMEAWACKKAVLVNGNCEVLKGHCVKSNAGLWYENYEEFKECLNLLVCDEDLRNKMGENGAKYVEENYGWTNIMGKYLRLLHRLSND